MNPLDLLALTAFPCSGGDPDDGNLEWAMLSATGGVHVGKDGARVVDARGLPVRGWGISWTDLERADDASVWHRAAVGDTHGWKIPWEVMA